MACEIWSETEKDDLIASVGKLQDMIYATQDIISECTGLIRSEMKQQNMQMILMGLKLFIYNFWVNEMLGRRWQDAGYTDEDYRYDNSGVVKGAIVNFKIKIGWTIPT